MTKFYKMARYVFFMASTVKKWTNFSKLAFKWPFWQPWCQPAQNTFKQRLRIHSITHCDITIQNVTHCVDWFSCLTFVLLLIYASTTTKSYILNYMCMAANFIIEGRMQTYGRRLCALALDYNFWTRNPSRFSKVSKDSDCSLISNQNFS